jgi:hypothetical protein
MLRMRQRNKRPQYQPPQQHQYAQPPRTVLVFRQLSALEDAIEFHAFALLEALARV